MRKRLKFISALLLLSIALSGCGNSPAEEANTKVSYKPDTEYNEKFKLRDRKDIYLIDNPEEVITMYLTVSTGNEGEKTDHTWSEINTYSVYDYDEMGVERYKVEGLLQVGDESGPLPGKLGYGQISPNCTIQIRGQSSSRQPVKNYNSKMKKV